MSEDKCPCCGMIPCIHGGLEKEMDYRICLQNLLEGLEVQQIEAFMDTATPERCRGLGKAITERTKALLHQRNLFFCQQQELLNKVKEYEDTAP